ncbi:MULTISPECIES: hypothetical protein [Planktothricoides]|uniref:Uncharacterized protein n=2 Tax=Planktothricoides raciborskii TaxID=132608 RepID=A0AAU8JM99_9CYAN|nr:MULTISPECIES: hypothetical protein [Planktothricoides]KOR37750.1 hypothetical protein AM228_04505 [Planktothricoides sp. SR001]MBD2543490.1 hypothetical protein [Planktothricoides raciborskii FACHB-1370]MBD2581180.1 hypothetical protein [Planktothricoides raciborskii FACHB-1261]
MSFTEAIKNNPLLANYLKSGLKALGSNSSKVKPEDTKKCEGRVDIDMALQSKYPNEPRWDYAIGYDGKTHFIEVHPADTSEVQSVLNKLHWLKNFLSQDAPQLNQEPKSFHWVASSGNHILPNSSQARKLAKSGIKVIGQLTLS